MEIHAKDLVRVDITMEKIGDYLSFVNGIKKKMKHPEWLGDFSEEDVFRVLENGGFCFLYHYNWVYVASSMIVPATEEDMKKFKLDKEGFDFSKTMDLGIETVMEMVRGNGIQSYIIQDMMDYSKKLGFTSFVATVHPDNTYSIDNFLKNGFVFHRKSLFIRGKRNIYIKKD